MESKKVILDTNLWISFLISKKLNALDSLLNEGKIVLVFSDELIEEFVKVITRPKFRKYFSTNDVKRILDCFDQFGKLIKVKSDVRICRDEKDNFLLNLAIDSKAHYLITGDGDLLVLNQIKNTRILTFADFMGVIS
ncbi:putative toxin-antitoxin system toxin component, PIN family [Sinomicrobium soli]|uniref:putative toxin-antitoxin system toxin component, PIN family n=1 Tax=Sinomicrobium sp. N-1-3-6 TaxID=2219864 RepID=UPI000DCB273F|nr:putative toxin-antitoxin system toxin component, PIN family [Sinomicrobium sp. N-1-3-6]RAV30098.1 putative toxin-antitoxin system toxin component, PIN family [Sinomicrobium sp. N-1-3-6]